MACLKSHSFKIIVHLKDLPCWKNEGSLYTFNVQFILIRFLGWLLNLQPREKTSHSNRNGTFVVALILIPVKSLTFLLQRGYTGEKILRNRKSYISPKGPATPRLHGAHPFISLALIQALEMYRGNEAQELSDTFHICPGMLPCEHLLQPGKKRHCCCCRMRRSPLGYPRVGKGCTTLLILLNYQISNTRGLKSQGWAWATVRHLLAKEIL